MRKKNGLVAGDMPGRPLPTKVSVEPTYRCNLNCSMCFYDKKGGAGGRERSIADFIDFLDTRENISGVIIPGREPMIKEGFFDLVAYLIKRRIPYVLLTNGLLIDKKNYKKFLGGHRPNKIYLSIDGDEKTHNAIRGSRAAFRRVVAAARLLAGKIDLCVVCTICEDNLAHLWRVPRIIRSIGLRSVTFEYERRYTAADIKASEQMMGRGGFELLRRSKRARPRYSLGKLEVNIEKMERAARGLGVEVKYFPRYFKEKMPDIYYRRVRRKNRLACRYFDEARIDPAGNVIHCFAYRKPFGNIKRSSLEEIWESKPYRNFRKKLAANNLMPICETCWGATPID